MKTQQDILHGRSLEDVAEAARAYEETHAPFDKRPMKMRARPPRRMMSKPDIALYMEKISVSFDGFKALNDLTFYVDKGELRCVIGPNGPTLVPHGLGAPATCCKWMKSPSPRLALAANSRSPRCSRP